ncbi:MAG TPA: hypothetical protein VGB74_06775 [Actinoplanes sp.]
MLTPTTVVPTPWWARSLVWLGVPVAGAALLYAAVRLLLWLPVPVFGFLRHLPERPATIGSLVLGAVLGLVLAAQADQESLTVRLTPVEVVLSRPGTTRTVQRGEVAVAFRDGDRLVLLGRTGRELAREPSHLSPARLRAAFAAHGIAWAEQDPYLAAYHRWVPGLPDLPAAAHAVFAARQTALETGDEADQRELREELGRLGFAVRDERKKQHWRRVDG